MSLLRKTLVPALAALCLGLVGVAGAQEQIPYSAIAPGGQATDGSFTVYSAVGQGVIGPASGPSDTDEMGFMYIARKYLTGTLVAVAITGFDAAISDGSVQLTWSIAESVDLVGFNIYRSTSESGTFTKIHDGVLSPEKGMGFIDESVRPGQEYWYRLGAVDRDGEFFSPFVSLTTPAWQTELDQNYPNPFNPSTTIVFYLAAPSRVSLRVYDVKGREIRELVDDTRNFGRYEVTWEGTNDNGQPVSSGIYFYRLIAGNKTFTKKMALIK